MIERATTATLARPGNAPTVPSLVLRALRRFETRIAFEWDGGSLTYGQTLDTIARMQAVFVAHGLRRGGCVALLSGNRADAWCSIIAAQGLGLRTTSLHPLGSVADQRRQLDDSEADLAVIDVANFEDRAAALVDAVPAILTLGATGNGSPSIGRCFESEMSAVGSSGAIAVAEPDDVATINYTGGTTGRSKGAMRRHRSNTASTLSILADFELPAVPRFLAVAPISHVAGTKVIPTLLMGGTVHVMHGFDPERVIRVIDERAINMTLLVPTMVYSLLDCPALVEGSSEAPALGTLELLLYGASPMAPSRLAEGLERIGPVFAQLYGQTECYPISLLGRAAHDPRRPDLFRSCGFPVSSAQVTLLDVDGQPVAPGEPGEICVASPYVMDAYWQQPELTQHAFRHGWLHTDDIARQDERGYLYIVDRAKDMIVSGGFNIYPKEIEDVLTAHADVAQAAVVGIPDDRWGEAVTAVVVPKPGATIDSVELTDLVREAKGRAHTPKSIEIVDALPLTAVGKVDKKRIRDPYWADQDRQVG